MSQGWFARSSKSIFSKINELNNDKQAWAAGQQGRSDQRLQTLASVYRSTKLDVQNQVAREIDIAASDAALAMQLADTKLKAWDEDRQISRKGRARKAFQESMTTFANFLENFSGVVEVVRAADDQYGGLAYGTLSVFVGVFVRKTQREESLIEGFDELSYAFPRLETLRSLGAAQNFRTPDELRTLEQLEKLLTETFALVVNFAREATQYYSSSARRFKDTFAPDRLKSGILVQIRDRLKKVREQCDILMLAQIASLHKKLDDMSAQISQTRDVVGQVAHWTRQSNIAATQSHESTLRKLLGIDQRSTNMGSDALDSLHSLLQNSFSTTQSTSERPEPTSLNLLKADANFSDWLETQNSCLFIAGGLNLQTENPTGSLNWLSEGAMLVIKELREQHENVAYYLVQSTLWVGRTHRRSLRDVMANLIFQIALMREDGFSSELDSLENLLNSPAWNENDADSLMEEARHVLLSIFSVFTPDCKIWVVIDRFDKCSWSDDDYEDGIDIQTALVSLLSVISEVACCVKILVVVDAPFARRFTENGSPMTKREKEYLMLNPEWPQVLGRNQLLLEWWTVGE